MRDLDSIAIINGRVVDPDQGIDRIDGLYIQGGKIVAVGAEPEHFVATKIIDAEGLIVAPGLVDLSARFREPGLEQKATIASESRAAVQAGFTTVASPPDTIPPTDHTSVIELIHLRAEEAACCDVIPVGALTRGLEGADLAEINALKKAGCRAFGNGLRMVEDTLVLRRAMEYCASYDVPVFLFAEDRWLSGGCANEGVLSTQLGLVGVPVVAETLELARCLLLVEQTGVRAHFHYLSSRQAVEMVGRAKDKGLPVTADTSLYQLMLSEEDLASSGWDTNYHVRPPLRSKADQEFLLASVANGRIDAICSNHQPHELEAKLRPFPESESGISSLDTFVASLLELVSAEKLTLHRAIAAVTSVPAAVLGIDAGSLRVGSVANVCLIDPAKQWQVKAGAMVSEGKNNPWVEKEVKGKVVATCYCGVLRYRDELLLVTEMDGG